ncbi:MAG: hypothetical protein ABRQ38_30510, partial [Candidatus Eremiobacterota bacterium]
IVFPDENALYNMVIYCGFSSHYNSWEKEMAIMSPEIEYIESKINIKIYEVTCFVELQDIDRYECVEFSVVSPVTEQVFNNKNLNYWYRFQ